MDGAGQAGASPGRRGDTAARSRCRAPPADHQPAAVPIHRRWNKGARRVPGDGPHYCPGSTFSPPALRDASPDVARPRVRMAKDGSTIEFRAERRRRDPERFQPHIVTCRKKAARVGMGAASVVAGCRARSGEHGPRGVLVDGCQDLGLGLVVQFHGAGVEPAENRGVFGRNCTGFCTDLVRNPCFPSGIPGIFESRSGYLVSCSCRATARVLDSCSYKAKRNSTRWRSEGNAWVR